METKKNNLPDSWGVLDDGSILFREIVIKYINSNYPVMFVGKTVGAYYGITKLGRAECYSSNVATYFDKKLTLDEFVELSKPIEVWVPKYGELIEVSNNNVVWGKFKYIAKIDNANYPYLVADNLVEFNKLDVSVNANVQAYSYIRRINVPFEITAEEVFELISSAKGVDKNNIKIIN